MPNDFCFLPFETGLYLLFCINRFWFLFLSVHLLWKFCINRFLAENIIGCSIIIDNKFLQLVLMTLLHLHMMTLLHLHTLHKLLVSLTSWWISDLALQLGHDFCLAFWSVPLFYFVVPKWSRINYFIVPHYQTK